MKERMKQLRRELGLTQQEFADRLGIQRGAISNYEAGRNTPLDIIVTQICVVFDVREEWLRTGAGEMFAHTSKIMIDDLCQRYQLDAVDCSLIEEYMKMKADDRKVLKEYLRRVKESACLR